MAEAAPPVVLELAPLPREQLGPFIILGIDKDADREQIEAAWAARVIAARKNQIRIALEDINWAREVVNDGDRRVRADVTSLNPDTADGVLRELGERYGVAGPTPQPSWQPWEVEAPPADYTPAGEVPSAAEVQAASAAPQVPREIPAIPWLLEQFVQEPLDPWNLPLSSE